MRDLSRLLLPVLFLSLSTPATAGLWTSIGPEGGSTIRRLLVDPVTPTTVYASSELGIYKSTDGGLTWVASGAGLPAPSLAYRIALAPSTPGTLYADVTTGFPDYLYKSTDGAGSWTLLPNAPTTIRSLGVDAANPALVYVGSSGGKIWRSADGGTTWSAASVPGTAYSVEALAADPVNAGIVYAATYELGGSGDRVYKSTDGGASFVATPLVDKDVLSLAVDPVTPSTVYAAPSSYSPPIDPPLWKSTDGGATWNSISTGLPTPFNAETPIAIDPTSPATVYVGGIDGPYRSVDGGATWTRMASGLTAPRTFALATHPTVGGTLWIGTEAGPGKSTDAAASWTMHGSGIREDHLDGFAVDPANPAILYAASGSQGIQKSLDAGAHWSAANVGLPLPSVGALVMRDGSTLHALQVDGEFVARTVDAAATWDVTTSGLPVGAAALSIAIDPSDPAVAYVGIDADNFASGSPAVYKSNDGGVTWSATAGPLDISVRALAVASSGRVYAGTDFPRLAFSSADGGASWSPGTFVPTGVVALAVDPADPLSVWAGTPSAGVFHSTDGAASFVAGAFVGTPQVSFLLVDPTTAGAVYAATTDGVLASLDSGAHWTDVSGGLLVRDTRALAADPTVPGRLYAATNGYAAFRRDLGPCTTDLDCDDANLCTSDACLPSDSASDAFGCVHAQPPCPPAGDCRTGAGVCNRDTGLCGYTNRPDGTACTSDGSVCTTDACSAGVCRHTAALDLSCRVPSVPGASTFSFKDNALPQRASLAWKWKKGDAALGEFGDPFSSGGTSYELCVFDRGAPGGLPRYLFGVRAPASGTCGRKPCWSSNGITIRYRDRDRTPDGLSTLVLKSGAPGQASLSASAKGVNLHLPTAALSPTVTVQLRNDSGGLVCWQGIYNAGVKKNVPGQFKAKSQ